MGIPAFCCKSVLARRQKYVVYAFNRRVLFSFFWVYGPLEPWKYFNWIYHCLCTLSSQKTPMLFFPNTVVLLPPFWFFLVRDVTVDRTFNFPTTFPSASRLWGAKKCSFQRPISQQCFVQLRWNFRECLFSPQSTHLTGKEKKIEILVHLTFSNISHKLALLSFTKW